MRSGRFEGNGKERPILSTGGDLCPVDSWKKTPALDRMRGSAVRRIEQSNVMGALPLIGEVGR
jgi:hypothetical protein